MQTEGFSAIHAHRAVHPATASAEGASVVGRFPVALQHGLLSTVSHIVRQEGVRSLWKGFSLNVFKGPLAVGVSFATYDWLKVALGIARAPGVE
jgi:hypothetical protein